MTSDDATVEEVRQAIRAEFAKGLKTLGINPDFHRLSMGSAVTNAESNSATHSYSVIDLVTSSTSSSIMVGPAIIPGSLISVAIPLPMLGMVGVPQDFRIYRIPHTLRRPLRCLPRCTRNQGISMFLWA